MPNPPNTHDTLRRTAVVVIALPVVITLAVLAFTWPTARLHPRDVPLGIVGSSPGSAALLRELDGTQPGAFDLRLYASAADARTAVAHHEVYGALDVTPSGVEVLESSAASPALAQLIAGVGQHAAASHGGRAAVVHDVVPLSTHDPRGLVFSSALLPLTICGIALAAVVGVVVRVVPAWRQLVALAAASAIAGAGSYLVAGVWLDALPHHGAAVWAVLSGIIFAVSATTAGLVALVGVPGLLLSAATMIVLGNPLSGATSAPEMLPRAAGRLGQWLPPGAGASLLRSTAYFDGSGAAGHLTVLTVWIVLGAAAVVVGHHAPIRFAARSRTEAEDTVPAAPSVRPRHLDRTPSARVLVPAATPDPG